eukprot:1158392-Pelagomonas_calceolata.AAC.18
MEEVTSALHAQQYQSSFLNALDLEAEDRPPARSSYVGGKLALSSRDGSIVSNSASTHCTSGAVRNRIDVSSKDGRGSSLHATAKGGGDLTPTQLAQLMWAVGYLGAGVLMQVGWPVSLHPALPEISSHVYSAVLVEVCCLQAQLSRSSSPSHAVNKNSIVQEIS